MSIPFLTPNQLEALGYAVPKPLETTQELMPLNLTKPYVATGTLLGYQKMYALDHWFALADYWQGYIQTPLYKIHTQVFTPKRETILGTVVVLHGYLEHSGIYQPLIGEILEQGFSVVIYDLPGHGLSEGEIANIHDFNHYQDVLLSIVQYIRPAVQLPQPWLGIGQSTGGAILMHHILHYAEKRQSPFFKRVLLLSPLVRPAKSAWWHNSVGLGIVKHIKTRVPRPFRRNNHNPEFLRFIRLQDPLQTRELGMDWILAMSKWMVEMEQFPSCRIPVWLAQGARDKTVDWQYNLEFIRHKFRLQVLLMLEEGSHQLVNERAEIRTALTSLIPSFLHAHGKSRYY